MYKYTHSKCMFNTSVWIHVSVCMCVVVLVHVDHLFLDDSSKDSSHIHEVKLSETSGNAAVQQHQSRLLRLLDQNVARMEITMNKVMNKELWREGGRGVRGEKVGVRERGGNREWEYEWNVYTLFIIRVSHSVCKLSNLIMHGLS